VQNAIRLMLFQSGKQILALGQIALYILAAFRHTGSWLLSDVEQHDPITVADKIK